MTRPTPARARGSSTIRRAVLGLLVVAAAVVGIAPECWACTCAKMSQAEQFDAADVVFSGVASDVESEGTLRIWTFDVTSLEKGGAAPEQEIIVDTANTCAYDFTEGDRYQVYAERNDDGLLFSTICSGTSNLDRDEEPFIGRKQPTPSPTPEKTLSPQEVIERGPMGTMIREQRAAEAARARRDWTVTGVVLAVIVLVTALLIRRRRRRMPPAA